MFDRLNRQFYERDVLELAPALLGKSLVKTGPQGKYSRYTITETEAYRGEDDLACHASKGRTPRTEVIFGEGGHVYMYLIYGMYWMLNVVAAEIGVPQAVLIRGVKEVSGPGRLTRLMGLDKEYYGEDLVSSPRFWIEENGQMPVYTSGPRIGIDYAGAPWKDMPWRYIINL